MEKVINGIRTNYEETGESGSRVLLLHGWGCDISLMKPVAEKLNHRHRVMMIDFPGHGMSDSPPEPWGVPEYSNHLIAFLKEMDFIPCAVIAHSFGARVAAWIAWCRYPPQTQRGIQKEICPLQETEKNCHESSKSAFPSVSS